MAGLFPKKFLRFTEAEAVRTIFARSKKTAAPPAQKTHCLLHKKSSKAVDFTSASRPKSTPRTGLCQQSNRSPPRRNGNWKIARRDRRPKSSPRGPKYRKLPTRDWGVPA